MRKRVWVVALVLAFGAAYPATALFCYECITSGFFCSGGYCVPVATCRPTTSFCSSCWDDCNETSDGYCIIGLQCQWAARPIAADSFAMVTSLPSSNTAP